MPSTVCHNDDWPFCFLFLQFLLCIYYTNSEKCKIGNYLRGGRCERCLPECRSGQVIIGRCNQTNNVKCECPVNKYWDGPLVICKKCTVCGLGQISILNCSHDENRKCEDCPKVSEVFSPFVIILFYLTRAISWIPIIYSICIQPYNERWKHKRQYLLFLFTLGLKSVNRLHFLVWP